MNIVSGRGKTAGVDSSRKKGTPSPYLWNLLSTAFAYQGKCLKISVDGQQLPEDTYLLAAIANGRVYGKGMRIAPDALLDDGFFDVVLVKEIRLLELIRNLHTLYFGDIQSHPKVEIIRGRRIDVDYASAKDQQALIEADGELLGGLPASFTIIPRVLPIRCSLKR